MAHTADEAELHKDLTAKLNILQGEQQESVAKQRAETFKLPYISLFTYPLNPEVVEILPKELAERSHVVVFYKQGQDVRIGVINPALPTVLEAVKYLQEKLLVDPQLYVISHRSFQIAIGRYRENLAQDIPNDEMHVDAASLTAFAETIKTLQDLGQHITTLPPTEVLSTIVAGAVKMNASDIHIEPQEKEARLRYRIDGVLQDIAIFEKEGWKLLLSRVKVLAKLKLNVHEIPQDGSFVLKIADETYDMRVSLLPGGYGENIVISLLNRASRSVKITDLGMKERDYKLVIEELKRTTGMILTTGPTGSGKTTTLASFIGEVNKVDVKIITLEDPIEYRLSGVEQTEIDVSAGYTFAKGLRAILRQDPDVIMVGEMRDAETAETALHAALTGHLVLSTLHTNDAPGAVPRLIDMGIKPFIIAPALNMVIAQRLVRVVCSQCRQLYTPDDQVREHVAAVMQGVLADIFSPSTLKDPQLQFARAQGCPACSGSGYRGRTGIYEIFSVKGEIEELILKGANSNQIREAALRQGMTTIAQDAYLKVIQQITTVEEVERVSEE